VSQATSAVPSSRSHSRSDHLARLSKVVGSPIGRFLILEFNVFVNLILPSGISRRLSTAEMRAYRGPSPTQSSRLPEWIFSREILHSHEYLAEVESNLERLSHKPTLILWGDRDDGFRDAERNRFEQLFPNHRVRILLGSKHFVQGEAPEQICEEVIALYASPDRMHESFQQ
jgi:haloalkane dehalogenase